MLKFSVDDPQSNICEYFHRLEVLIDAANTGEWESCVKVDDLRLPDNWATKAYIGLTATTGALADNHDILSLKTYSDTAVMEEKQSVEIDGLARHDSESAVEYLNRLLKTTGVSDARLSAAQTAVHAEHFGMSFAVLIL